MKNKKQVVIIQGGSTFKEYGDYIKFLKNWKVSLERLHKITWKDTLQKKLGKGHQVINLKMPHNMNARYEEWKILFELYIPLFSDKLILIGQSLGGVFLVKYLSENLFPQKIEKIILVSTPYSEDGLDSSLGGFSLGNNLKVLESRSYTVIIVHSTDDPVVPFEHAQKYHNDIKNSTLVPLKDRQHISKDNFPEIVSLILNK